MRFVFGRVVAISCLLAGSVHAQEESKLRKLEPIEIPALSEFREPTDREKESIGQWLMNLETALLAADTFAFQAECEAMHSQTSQGERSVAVRMYQIEYAEHHGKPIRKSASMTSLNLMPSESQRPGVVDDGLTRRVVQVDDRVWNVINGRATEIPRRDGFIPFERLQKKGLFLPTRAVTANTSEILYGNAASMDSFSLRSEFLKKAVQKKDVLHTLWQFRGTGFIRRIVSFRDGTIVQSEDRLAIGPPTAEPRIYSRTRTAWSEFAVGDEKVILPVKLRSQLFRATTPMDFSSTISWRFNGQVDRILLEPPVDLVRAFGGNRQAEID